MALTLSEGNKYSTGRLKLANKKSTKKTPRTKAPKSKMPMMTPGMGDAGMVKMKQVTASQMAKMGC